MSFFIDEQVEVLYKYHRHDEDYEDNIAFLQGPLNNFIGQKVALKARENDREEKFSEENFHELGSLGFISMPVSENAGGMGQCFSYYCAGLESLAKADAGFTLGVAIHGTMCDGIARFASPSLREQYLANLIHGRQVGAFCLSEACCGSDAQAMRLSYTRDQRSGEYILNGSKYWITNGLSAEVFFVMACSDKKEISAFIVDKTGKGEFQQNEIAEKMGVRGSNTAELIFRDYRLPAQNLVGQEGEGFKYAMHMLNGGRITIAAWSTGIAQGAYEKLLKYSHERQLFGRLLKDLDNTKRELSEMLMEICASRELAYNAGFYKESPQVMRHAALAKIKASETAVHVGERAIELAGGYGYVKDSCIERHLRDALLGRIGEGANEVLKIMVLPRAIFKSFEKNPLAEVW